MVGFFFTLGKNKVHQIVMFAKQKSCAIIDVEKRFFSGVSDEQEKSYEFFNI